MTDARAPDTTASPAPEAVDLPEETQRRRDFLQGVHPYDCLTPAELTHVAQAFQPRDCARGETVYAAGDTLEGLYLVLSGMISVVDANGAQVSRLGARNSFGERGLVRGGVALTTARAVEPARLLVLPKTDFHHLRETNPAFARFFDRARAPVPEQKGDLATQRVADLMAHMPIAVRADCPVQDAAALMRDTRVSCVAVTDKENTLQGIVTVRDMTAKVVAVGMPADAPVSRIMTPDPRSLPPSALGSDVLHMMLEHRIGHVPVVDAGKLVGIVTQTDLTRFQAVTSAALVSDIAHAATPAQMAEVTARLPMLLAHLVGGHNRHEVVTRLLTDIADACTRRLLRLAEAKLGAAPVPYLWLACGSQGRQEQTGVSDQDNCMILSDELTPQMEGYFAALARFVCEGLATCGYVLCPGDMMATNPRWRQPVSVWQGYFKGWIAKPDPTAQMLASVMFDLRPIGGDESLWDGLQADTLAAAQGNSIFVSHMIANSLKHTPPLSMFRGFATERSGDHAGEVDLKHNGVVPVVDLGRVYALKGRLTPVNTRARLKAAIEGGVVSASGGQDLLDAYDLIAETRLDQQAAEIRRGGKPDNHMKPSDLSDLERSHLRDAFVVIRTMQSAVGQGRGMLG